MANPRKRRRRKSTTRRRKTYRRRRNPGMALAAANPRRRRRRSVRRRRRNPGLGKTRMKLAGIDLTKAALGSVGFIGSIAATKLLNIPGNFKYVAPAGIGLAVRMIGSRFIGTSNANAIMVGAVMASAVIAVNDFLIPEQYRIPALMSGIGQEDYLTAEEILSGTGQTYTDKIEGMGQGYEEITDLGAGEGDYAGHEGR